MISVHCICHRLALSCTDTNTSISYINEVERTLRTLWNFFENSPKRCATLTKIQIELHKIETGGLTKEGRKALSKKVKKACHTRWLSFDSSVQSVYDEFVAVTQTLRTLKDHDPTADGLLRKIDCVKFLGVIVILHSILPKLSALSKTFQQGSVNLSGVAPALSYTKDSLDEIVRTENPIKELEKEVSDLGRYETLEWTPSSWQINELKSLLGKYVTALKENIDNRFAVTLPVLSDFDVFNPLLVPEREIIGFKEYGIEKVKILADHFSKSLVDNKDEYKEEVLASWGLFKFELLKFKHSIPQEILQATTKSCMTDVTPIQWTIQNLLANRASFQAYDKLVMFAEVFLTMPVSNAWPERGVSAIKRVKSRLRSSLKEDMLRGLLQVNINGPKVEDKETAKMIDQCVVNFKNEKHRRKLSSHNKASASVTEQENQREYEDAAVQADLEENQIMAKVRSVTKLATLLGLDSGDHESDEGDLDDDDYDYDF